MTIILFHIVAAAIDTLVADTLVAGKTVSFVPTVYAIVEVVSRKYHSHQFQEYMI